jgi:hypothetical protein
MCRRNNSYNYLVTNTQELSRPAGNGVENDRQVYNGMTFRTIHRQAEEDTQVTTRYSSAPQPLGLR